MGYALGCYVAIPNFGLFDDKALPKSVEERNTLVSGAALVTYVLSSVLLWLLGRGL